MEFSAQTAKTILWITTLIFGIGALASIIPIMMSPMMFDAPGSEKSKGLWLVMWSMLSFPVLCVISIVVAWIKYRNGAPTAAVYWSILPLLSILGVVLGFYLTGK